MSWQTIPIPLASGMNTGADPRALQPPALAVCRNAEFNETGGRQKRYPYVALSRSILGGGNITDQRRIVAFGDELLLFTKDSLYSWSARDSAWVLKGTHLAAKLTERSRFVDNYEQITPARAELGNCVVFAWTRVVTAGVELGQIYVAAMDKTTGAVILPPTFVDEGCRPKLVVTTNRIILLIADFNATGNLSGIAINPASVAASVAGGATTVYSAANGFNNYYDAVASGTTTYVVARRNPTTSYEIMTVTEALVTARVTKARTGDGPIAIALAPNGTHLTVVRANGTGIRGDYLSLAGPFTDVTTGQVLGTGTGTINQIAAAYRTVQDSSQYRCYVFWSSSEATGATDWTSQYNYVDTGGTIGAEANFVRRLGIASRAFDHNGRVFVWTAFAGQSSFSGAGKPGFRAQLQNTYFLYRDDAFLTAKAAPARAGGFVQVTAHLGHVQNLGSNVYGWAGVERRVVPTSAKQTGYSARAPREVLVEFDSDEARRCVRLGETLYITGGEILQYDGVRLVELGFHIYPWYFGAIDAAGGSVAAGDYAMKWTLRYDNAKGERERSTTATVGTVTITVNRVSVPSLLPLHVTHKTAIPPSMEYWRSLVNPVYDAPFYLGTSQDPATAAGSNRHVPNDPTVANLGTFNDDLADTTISSRESNNENGGILENLAPPAATILAATQDRLFLAGLADAPNRVLYTKLRGDTELAAFHDALFIDLPPDGGPITALAIYNDLVYVFKETALFILEGDGLDNAGGGVNYGPARLLSADVGAQSQEAVCRIPLGLLFKSDKGWFLTRGADVQYVGEQIKSFDSWTVEAVTAIETKHQVRLIVTSGGVSALLVWDYRVNQWSEWDAEDEGVHDGIDATVWRGSYVYLTRAEGAAHVKQEQAAYGTERVSLVTETPWIKLAGPDGWARVRRFILQGEYRSGHRLRLRAARKYDQSDSGGVTWGMDVTWTVSPTTVGGTLRVRKRLPWTKVDAIKIRIEDLDASTAEAPLGEGLRLTALSLEVKPKDGLTKQLPAAQNA